MRALLLKQAPMDAAAWAWRPAADWYALCSYGLWTDCFNRILFCMTPQVAEGFRPPRHARIPEAQWELIQVRAGACMCVCVGGAEAEGRGRGSFISSP